MDGGVGEGKQMRTGAQRRSGWAWLVTLSACVVLGVGVTIGVWWAVTSERQVTSYSVRGQLSAISLDLGDADAEIVGGRDQPVVEVRRTDDFAFGHPPVNERELSRGVLRLRSRCAQVAVGTCSAKYRLNVPNNVPITVVTRSGDVDLDGFRGSARIATRNGDIAASSFCGFLLDARAETGDVSATAACAPERLELRSRTGDVQAVVPPGRYRVDADSDEGARTVRGLVPVEDAPFQILALSGAGDVAVESGP
jgi:Putative adhesin